MLISIKFCLFFSQRTGQIRVLSFKVGLILLCHGHLEEKYRCEYQTSLIPDFEQIKLLFLLTL